MLMCVRILVGRPWRHKPGWANNQSLVKLIFWGLLVIYKKLQIDWKKQLVILFPNPYVVSSFTGLLHVYCFQTPIIVFHYFVFMTHTCIQEKILLFDSQIIMHVINHYLHNFSTCTIWNVSSWYIQVQMCHWIELRTQCFSHLLYDAYHKELTSSVRLCSNILYNLLSFR